MALPLARVHELLPLIVGQPLVDDVLRKGHRFYRPRLGAAFMPVEFQAAAYRFGHSMVRPSYRANLKGDDGNPFFGMVFDPAGEGEGDPVDLRGGARAARRFIGWQTFFDFGDGQVKPNKKIDTKISTALFHLPLGAIASHDAPAGAATAEPAAAADVEPPGGPRRREGDGRHPSSAATTCVSFEPYGFERKTPLWYYVLKEAEVQAGGLTLGRVGGRLVAEVLVGLLLSDPSSYLLQRPSWTPTLTSAGADFGMTDFLTFAGVDPGSETRSSAGSRVRRMSAHFLS